MNCDNYARCRPIHLTVRASPHWLANFPSERLKLPQRYIQVLYKSFVLCKRANRLGCGRRTERSLLWRHWNKSCCGSDCNLLFSWAGGAAEGIGSRARLLNWLTAFMSRVVAFTGDYSHLLWYRIRCGACEPLQPANNLVKFNILKPGGHYTYRQFNIQQFYVLPTQCIYVFCVDLRTNSDYFPIQL